MVERGRAVVWRGERKTERNEVDEGRGARGERAVVGARRKVEMKVMVEWAGWLVGG